MIKSGAMDSRVDEIQVTADVLHDVDLAIVWPTKRRRRRRWRVLFGCGQEPKRRPASDCTGQFSAHLEHAVLVRELRVETRRCEASTIASRLRSRVDRQRTRLDLDVAIPVSVEPFNSKKTNKTKKNYYF